MSVVEYLKLIPKGIKNVDKVFEGIKNQIKIEIGNIPEDQLDVITTRRLICQECPYMSSNAIKLGIYKSDRPDEHCSHCSCNIKFKTASLDSNCGIEAYNKTKEKEEDKLKLKWEKFKNNE